MGEEKKLVCEERERERERRRLVGGERKGATEKQGKRKGQTE